MAYKPYTLEYRNQEISFFDPADLEWIRKETPRRHPWAIEQRKQAHKQAFRFFKNQTAVRDFSLKILDPTSPVIYS